MSKRGHKIDIVTRKRDASWPEFSTDQDSYPGYEENLRILRFSFGGNNFLNKEELWPHIPDLVDKMLQFYGENQERGVIDWLEYPLPLLVSGAEKLDKLVITNKNWSSLNEKFKFSKRIACHDQAKKFLCRRTVTNTDWPLILGTIKNLKLYRLE